MSSSRLAAHLERAREQNTIAEIVHCLGYTPRGIADAANHFIEDSEIEKLERKFAIGKKASVSLTLAHIYSGAIPSNRTDVRKASLIYRSQLDCAEAQLGLALMLISEQSAWSIFEDKTDLIMLESLIRAERLGSAEARQIILDLEHNAHKVCESRAFLIDRQNIRYQFCNDNDKMIEREVHDYQSYLVNIAEKQRRHILGNATAHMAAKGLLPQDRADAIAERLATAMENELQRDEQGAAAASSWVAKVGDRAGNQAQNLLPVPSTQLPTPSWPASWEEVRERAPNVRRWAEVKRQAGLSGHKRGFDQAVYELLVEHLRNHETGLGIWATSVSGLPRNALRAIDPVLRQEIYALGNPDFPEDLNVPKGSPGRPAGPQAREGLPTAEEVQAARNILYRAAKGISDGEGSANALKPEEQADDSPPPTLPTAPPIKWSIANRLQIEDENGVRRETPPEFVRRVYSEFLGKGLTRAKLRALDRPLVQQLEMYARDHGMPDDLLRDLPTDSERSRQEASRWSAMANVDGSAATYTTREALRLARAAQRHKIR